MVVNRIPPYLSLGVVTLGHDLARNIIQSFLGGLSGSGILLILLGLGMWTISFFIKGKQPAPPAPPVTSEPLPPAA
jgi:hypothetical protein